MDDVSGDSRSTKTVFASLASEVILNRVEDAMARVAKVSIVDTDRLLAYRWLLSPEQLDTAYKAATYASNGIVKAWTVGLVPILGHEGSGASASGGETAFALVPAAVPMSAVVGSPVSKRGPPRQEGQAHQLPQQLQLVANMRSTIL